jgi:hypothetical protein
LRAQSRAGAAKLAPSQAATNTQIRPVWPLLAKVAKGKEYGELIALTDSEHEIVRRIRMFDPQVYAAPPEEMEFGCER